MSAPIPRPGPAPSVDPDAVVSEVDRLLADVDAIVTTDSDDSSVLVSVDRQARILERAHQVLVDALAAVDKN